MLVVLFWILLFICLISLLLLIVFLIIKKKGLTKLILVVLSLSIIGLGITLKACSDKVKSDFGFHKDNRNDFEKLQEEKRKNEEILKTINDIKNINKSFDSLNKTLQRK